MITAPEDYLTLLYRIQDENRQTVAILLPKDETIYDIDLDSRTIKAPEFLSVEKDHYSEVIYFRFDRYYDNMDLTNAVCVIQYINENAKNSDGLPAGGYAYPVPFYDVTHYKNENKVLIPWVIGGPATAAAGPITFAIKFYLLDEEGKHFIYDLNTLVSSSKVLHGMNVLPNDEDYNYPADDAPISSGALLMIKMGILYGFMKKRENTDTR